MATQAKGQITLRGRFPDGAHVRLVEVRDETVLRSEGGKLVATGKVRDGEVKFKDGVKAGARYFAVGYVNGQPLEVRVRGNTVSDDTALAQPPVGPDRVRLSDGSWLDEAPDREKAPRAEVGPAPAQRQVPKGTPQRSETPRGTAHPVVDGEPAPYAAQGDVSKGAPQMSDTELGRAAPIIAGPARQEDVPKGVPQRSETPSGVATVIPAGDAVEAVLERESSLAKVARGEPGRAAAEPLVPRREPTKKALGERDVADANKKTAKKSTAKRLAAKLSGKKK
jgi:hypothetical protein